VRARGLEGRGCAAPLVAVDGCAGLERSGYVLCDVCLEGIEYGWRGIVRNGDLRTVSVSGQDMCAVKRRGKHTSFAPASALTIPPSPTPARKWSISQLLLLCVIASLQPNPPAPSSSTVSPPTLHRLSSASSTHHSPFFQPSSSWSSYSAWPSLSVGLPPTSSPINTPAFHK
jgi:hypothetical protein